MSDILIKDVQMPEDLGMLRLRIFSGGSVEKFEQHQYHTMKPGSAVQVPVHGDLTDKQELFQTAKQYCQGCSTTYYDSTKCYDCWVGDMLELIDGAPVVIKASEEK